MVSVNILYTNVANASDATGNSDAAMITISDSNDIYKQFEKEAKSLYNQALLPQDLQEQMQALIKKYDGAEVSYNINENDSPNVNNRAGIMRSITKPASVQEKFVDGGVNDYAKSKSALGKLRTYYGTCENLILAGGTIAGAFAGPIGAAAGAFGGKILGKRCSQAQSDVKKMINKKRSKGGCRMTLTDEFPIGSVNSKKQVSI